jgi:regulator of sigma E protease
MIRFYLYALVFNLGILIFVHELGHFIAARASGVTVERFSIGFGPRIIRFTRGATEYAISVIPFGGYVKMSGMDPQEIEEGEQPGPHTFLGKRMGIRALIVASGPFTNFVWAIIVILGLLLVAGVSTGGSPIVGEVTDGSAASRAGLAFGDRILSVDNVPVDSWSDVDAVAVEDGDNRLELTVERGAALAGFEPGRSGGAVAAAPETLRLTLDSSALSEPGEGLGFTPYVPPVVGDIMSRGPAERAGLLKGDRIVSIDTMSVDTWTDLGRIVRDHAGDTLSIAWLRGGQLLTASVVPEEGEEPVGTTGVRKVGLIGIVQPIETRRVGLLEALGMSVRYVIVTLSLIAEFFVGLVTREVSVGLLGGPIRVVQMASESARWGASYFFGFMAFMSLNLFLINMLPLPILDGGHLLLMGLEKIRGRGLTERQLMVWQQVGIVFFISLMVLLLALDAFRLR